jgi:hypothetical protein
MRGLIQCNYPDIRYQKVNPRVERVDGVFSEGIEGQLAQQVGPGQRLRAQQVGAKAGERATTGDTVGLPECQVVV